MTSKNVTALILVAGLSGFVLGRLTTNLKVRFPFGGGSPASAELADYALEDPGNPAQDSELVPVGSAPFLGASTAKVTLVEFSDFQCPYCGSVLPVISELLDSYEPGELRVVFKNLPLGFHEHAELAAQAALAAAEQGRFWAYHDLMFSNQHALDRPALESYAERLDLDMAAFTAALDEERHAETVQSDTALAHTLGLGGTPSFLINGHELVGAQPAASFRAVIDSEIEEVDALLSSGVPPEEVYRRRVEANRASAVLDQ